MVSATEAAPPLRVGTDEWPPYEYTGPDGTVTGFSTDVVRAVMDELGMAYGEIQVLPWARAEAMAFSGELDVLFSASHSDRRLEHCYFPDEPLIESPNVLFIRAEDKDRLRFDALADLRGHTVGIVRDYAYTPEFLDFVKANVDHSVALDDASNFKLLSRGRVDYIPADLGNGLAMIDQMGLAGKIIPLRNHPIKTSGIYAMFSKKTVKPPTVRQFSKALAEFRKTPEYQRLYDRYFGDRRVGAGPAAE
ncbi:MAG: substrate-binding periplasmic protein [Desulfococcaceae bacterium]